MTNNIANINRAFYQEGSSIAYRNFMHSLRSPKTRSEYVRSLHYYMAWLKMDVLRDDDNYDKPNLCRISSTEKTFRILLLSLLRPLLSSSSLLQSSFMKLWIIIFLSFSGSSMLNSISRLIQTLS